MFHPGLNWVYLPDHNLAGNLKRSTKGSSIKPLRAYLFEALWGRGLIETGGGGLFNLEKTMVSVFHEELEYKVEILKFKKVGGHAA